MKNLGFFLVGIWVVACSKSESSGSSSTRQSSVTAAPSAPLASEAIVATDSAPASEPARGAAGDTAPASFKSGAKVDVAGAVGLGCEATSLDGWLQFLCRKKNGTGGRPTRAVIRIPGPDAAAERENREPAGNALAAASEDPGEEVVPNEYGELRVVVPHSDGERRDATLEWSDTRYTLRVDGGKATLEWAAAGIPLRKACAALVDEARAQTAKAQKLEGESKVTATEVSKLPRLGICQPAGLGSWAIGLRSLSGTGEGASRALRIELDAIRVDMNGTRLTADFGTFTVAAGGLEMAQLQVYDFDDDGRDELIVPHELKAPAASSTAAFPSPIWTFSDSAVSPYAKAPSIHGGVTVEHLDFDMRPDLGSYGPFVGYLGADCGLKSCPSRLTGPKLLLHALPDGSFSPNDEAVRDALKRACPNKPATIVVEFLAQTAKNLVCARAHGVPNEAISAELTSKRALLCGQESSCGVETTLNAWLMTELPIALAPKP